MTGLLTIGETLAVVAANTPGRLIVGASGRVSFAGAESNVAIAAARLGASVSWVGRVGADEFGRMISDALRAEGIDTTGVIVDDTAPTALMVRHSRTADTISVRYYRRCAAGSKLNPKDIDEATIAGAEIVHLTGITPALGPEPAALVSRVIEVAKNVGTAVSIDVNYRQLLWTAPDAAAVIGPLARRADIIFAGPDELELIAAGQSTKARVSDLLSAGVGEVVVKDGKRGATATTLDHARSWPATEVTEIDPVGAGDAFVGAYLAALLEGHDLPTRLDQACLVGGIAVSTFGDWEGLPTSSELRRLSNSRDVHR